MFKWTQDDQKNLAEFKRWLCYRVAQRSELAFFLNQIMGVGAGGRGASAALKTLNVFLQAGVNHLSLFLFPCQMKPMLTTIGTLDPPLGNARLQASKLIAAILATNSDTINAELANLGTLQVLWVGIQIKIQFTREALHYMSWMASFQFSKL